MNMKKLVSMLAVGRSDLHHRYYRFCGRSGRRRHRQL